MDRIMGLSSMQKGTTLILEQLSGAAEEEAKFCAHSNLADFLMPFAAR